jgi:CubicO group peptidase (beta-lactamase class C family)
MTPSTRVRPILRPLLVAACLPRLPMPAHAQSATATPAAPTLAERLDRLSAEIDRNRIDLHVPGAALAIVRGDQVIFARGFGVADVEHDIAAPQFRLAVQSKDPNDRATIRDIPGRACRRGRRA